METKKICSNFLLSLCNFMYLLVLLAFVAVANETKCQEFTSDSNICAKEQALPAGWQTNTYHLIECYPEVLGDTVIARSCGTKLSVSCVRNTGRLGLAYTFVVRDLEDGAHYRYFRALKETADTMADTDGRMVESRTRYYIRDMRVADSTCFFCGMCVTTRTMLPLFNGVNDVPVHQSLLSVDSVGILGRFSLSYIITPQQSYLEPGDMPLTSPGSGDAHGNGVLPTSISYELGDVVSTAVLDKMWLDQGLNMDMTYAHQCPLDTPFTWDTVYYDSMFPRDSVQAFIIGRLKDDARRSCLVNVKDVYAPSCSYTVEVSPLESEIFYDITGIDARVFISSRFGRRGDSDFLISYRNDFVTNHHSYRTLGVRYRDLYRHQIKHNPDYSAGNTAAVPYLPWSGSDYSSFNTLHLYQSSMNLYNANNDVCGRNYGHLCRMKNNHVPMISGGIHYGELYTNQDFCILASFNNFLGLIHIDENMDPVYAFYLSDNGHRRLYDVVCVGNTLANSIAVACETSEIDLVDWGTQMNGLGMVIGYRPSSVHLTNSYMETTSLDMYHNGSMLLAGGLDHSVLVHSMQRKNAWNGNWTGNVSDLHNQPDYISCFSKTPLQVGSKFDIDHAAYELKLFAVSNREKLDWKFQIPTDISDSEIVVICGKNNQQD